MISNSVTATQSTSTDQPTLVTNAVAGLPALQFNGTSDCLQLSSLSSSYAFGTIFIVTMPTAVTANARFFDFGNGATSNNVYISEPTNTGASLYVYNGSTASSVTSSSAITLNQYQLLETQIADIDSSYEGLIYTNGVLGVEGSIDYPNSVTRADNFIGTNYANTLYFQGQIAEILMYQGTLSASARRAVEGYLFARYHIKVSTPYISPNYGVFATTQTVTITDDPGAVIHYTTDGSTPTTSSPTYTGSFNVTSSTTVQAIGVQSWGTSAVASTYIQVDPNVANVPTTNLASWFKADNGVSTSGSNVTQWLDMSPNADNASQTGSSAQPSLVTNAINGLPAVSFNGSSQFLQVAANTTNAFGSVTIFVVAKPTAAPTNATILDYGKGATNDNIKLLQPTSTGLSLYVYSGSSSSSVTSSSAVTLNQAQLWEATATSSGTGTIFTNSKQGVQGSVYGPDLSYPSQNFIGTNNANSAFFEGQIAEILIYQGIPTTSNIVAVQDYLMNRYGIAPTVSAPTIAPSYGVISSSTISFSGDQGSTFYYTLNGSTPTTASTLYSSPFYLESSSTVKAIASQPWGTSAVSSAVLQVDMNTAAVPTTGLLTWLKADYGVSTSGTSVTQWTDCSPTANNASQTNSSNQPTLVPNAVNGLPAISFNGTSQYLQLGAGFANLTAGPSAFVVVSPSNSSTGSIFDIGNGSASNNFTLSTSGSTPTVTAYNGSTGSSLSASGVLSTGQYQLLEAFQTGSSSGTLSVNGEQVASGSLNNLTNTTRSMNNIASNYSGTSSFLQGNIAEMLIYNQPLTVTEKAEVEAYLIQRYQLHSLIPPAPIISVASGTLGQPTQVAISSMGLASIYYTTDGSTPTIGSMLYIGPINVAYSQTVKAIAVLNGVQSTVSTASYTLNSVQWPSPNGSDTSPLNVNVQLPTSAIPQ